MVDYLGRFPLPVEVVPYGSEQLFKRFEALGYKPTFRERDGERYLTDSKTTLSTWMSIQLKTQSHLEKKSKA